MNKLYDEITIRIRPADGRITVEEHTGGVVAVKNISHDSLVDCFSKSIKDLKTIRTGFLPDNCLSYTVNDRSKTVALRIPPQYIDVTYHNTVYERFPLPAMAFSIRVGVDGRTSNHRLAVIKDEKPAPGTPLYVYPFSNVFDDSRICIGAANSLPAYKSLRTLTYLPYYILRLPNNDHMFLQSNNKLRLSYRDLLEHLKDKDPSYYYENVLIPKNAVLQDFIDDKLGEKQ
ncbi:MAG: prokaryotic E2 ligase family D protein [Oscillospiraceae bacterium]|nr:prokaryotic E2 ligase family D protein [Oscillospiraceae bacterium]